MRTEFSDSPVTDFEHVIITRIHVRINGWTPLPGNSWARERLERFAAYCLPSVRAQTVRSFRWVLLIDEESSEWLEESLGILADGLGEVVRVSGPCTSDAMAALISAITSSEYVITTRLDSDDAISSRFVQEVQRRFEGQDFEFVNFPVGLQYVDGKVYWYAHPSNAFISLIERRKAGALESVFIDWHDRVSRHGPIRQVRTSPMWLQVVHGGNAVNELRGFRVKRARRLNQFSLSVDAHPENYFGVLIDQARSVWRILVRGLRKPGALVRLLRV